MPDDSCGLSIHPPTWNGFYHRARHTAPYGTGKDALFKPLSDEDVKFYTGKVRPCDCVFFFRGRAHTPWK